MRPGTSTPKEDRPVNGQRPDTTNEVTAPAAQRRKRNRPAKTLDGVILTRPKVTDIEVTQSDIDKATRANSHSCMIADAIKRQYPEFTKISVDLATIRWSDKGKDRRVMCLTPLVCQQKLAAFDFGTMPKPFKFSLTATQVTKLEKTEKDVDADGKPVKRPDRPTATKTRRVSGPSKEKTLHNSSPTKVPSRDLIVGGHLPPQNRASLKREFGIRAFTWADGEDPYAIAARRKALGAGEV